MIPTSALLLSAATHLCACGMKKGDCFCELAAPRGAHCDKDGGCSMKSAPRPDPTPLLASLDLRGWLREAARFAGPGEEPVGRVTVAVLSLPAAPAHLPDTPPPRSLPIV